MTSESKYGSARNSLVWLGVAKSTHRASERVRGSGRGAAGHGSARLGEAWLGIASHTASVRGCGREARPGVAWQGVAWPGVAWQTHSGSSGPLQFAGQGEARHGVAGRGKANTQRLLGAVAVCWARTDVAWQGAAWQGPARQTHSGSRAVAVCEAWHGVARRGAAGQGTIIRLITGQFYDRHRKPNR